MSMERSLPTAVRPGVVRRSGSTVGSLSSITADNKESRARERRLNSVRSLTDPIVTICPLHESVCERRTVVLIITFPSPCSSLWPTGRVLWGSSAARRGSSTDWLHIQCTRQYRSQSENPSTTQYSCRQDFTGSHTEDPDREMYRSLKEL